MPVEKISENTMDENFMRRCIQLAKNGLGSTAPNPAVGAVVVYRNKIIGEGFTSPFGGSHAEVNAIKSVKNKELLPKSVLYVTLEPCSHFGKTPPCADMIIATKIPKVVIGLLDPHEKVAGKGIQKLRDAGCEVHVGVLQKECREHHKRFLTFHEKKRPYIILKWAETADGFIAPERELRETEPQPYWITGELARQLVHKWRSEEQAILVGTTTVLEDNPKLNVRLWNGKSPIRIVLDKELKIPMDYHVLDTQQRTIVVTNKKEVFSKKKGVEYIQLDSAEELAEGLCKALYALDIQSVLVEGGAQTLQTFIGAGLWDEARIFQGPSLFKKGVKAPRISGTSVASKKLEQDHLKLLKND